MAYSNDERRMVKISGWIGKVHFEKLMKIADQKKLSISRLIGIAIDHELFESQNPFHFDLSSPDEKYVEYAYAEQASKIVEYMRDLKSGIALDVLFILRRDIGIPDEREFKLAFRECLSKNLLESFPAPKSVKYLKIEDTVLYRLNINSKVESEKKAKQIRELKMLEKLKKKYEK